MEHPWQAPTGGSLSPRLAFDPPKVRATFRFGDCLPPDDVVGHFVIGLSAVMGDLLLLNTILFPPDDPDRNDLTHSERSALMRWLLGAIWEAHLFVEDAVRTPEVASFVQEIEAAYPAGQTYSGADIVAILAGRDGATRPALRNVMRVARNSTFHYPKVGSADYVSALAELSDAEGYFEGGTKMPSLRMACAEDVMLNIAFQGLELEGDVSVATVLSSLADTVVALVHVAQVAVDQWFGLRHGVQMKRIENVPDDQSPSSS